MDKSLTEIDTAAGARSGRDALAAQRHAVVLTPTRQALRRFRRHRLAVVGVVVVSIFILLAIFAPIIARSGPNAVDLLGRNQGPTAKHWLGTDRTGRSLDVIEENVRRYRAGETLVNQLMPEDVYTRG